MIRTALLCCALLGAAACTHVPRDGGEAGNGTDAGNDGAFTYTLDQEQRAGLRVESNGEPVAGALVKLLRPADPGETQPGVVWQGVTNEAGLASGVLSLRVDDEALHVVVQKPGYTGPFSDPDRQVNLGAFAPSAELLDVPVAQLSNYTVALEQEAQ